MRIALVNSAGVSGRAFVAENWRADGAVAPPVELARLAAIARLHHHDVTLIDCAIEDGIRRVVNQVQRLRPHLLVVCATPGASPFAKQLANVVRQRTHTVGIGPFFSLMGAEALKAAPAVNAVLVGEIEKPFVHVMNQVQVKHRIVGCGGAIWRNNGRICHGKPERPIDDIDALPMPARDLLRKQAYLSPETHRPYTVVATGRGCPHQCSFCAGAAQYGPRVRHHSVSYIATELAHVVDDCGIDDVAFTDPGFTHERDYAMELCDAIVRRHLHLHFSASVRADTVDLELARAMRHAGCHTLVLGIESGDQGVLDQACKGKCVDAVVRCVNIARQAGLRTVGQFVFGLPGETPETAGRTVRYAMRLHLSDIACHPAVPLPGTPMGDLARRNGWLTTAHWDDFKFDGRSRMNNGTIKSDMVELMCRMLLERFYRHPRQLARRLLGAPGRRAGVLQGIS